MTRDQFKRRQRKIERNRKQRKFARAKAWRVTWDERIHGVRG